MAIDDVYASDGIVIPHSITNPNTAWLREVKVSDLFLFLIKLTSAGLALSAILAIPALIIFMIVKN